MLKLLKLYRFISSIDKWIESYRRSVYGRISNKYETFLYKMKLKQYIITIVKIICVIIGVIYLDLHMKSTLLCESSVVNEHFNKGISELINILKSDIFNEINKIMDQEDFIEQYKYFNKGKYKINTLFYDYVLKDPTFVKIFLDQISWEKFIIDNINCNERDLKIKIYIMFFDYISQKQSEFNNIMVLTSYFFYNIIRNLIPIIIPKIMDIVKEVLFPDNSNLIEPNRLTLFERIRQLIRYLFGW